MREKEEEVQRLNAIIDQANDNWSARVESSTKQVETLKKELNLYKKKLGVTPPSTPRR